MSEPASPNPSKPESGAMARAERIFFEVVGLSPADRAEAIARLAAGDEPLRLAVLRLLDSAAAVGEFLEEPVLGKAFDELERDSGHDAPDDLVGATLGHFRLQRRIASGGMGTVYLAVRSDAQFDQRVAIKVVKRGMDTDEIVRRFREERQTLAQLDHPNIARLLDGGVTPDGRPYLVMEFVDGLPIDEYCDTRRLSITDRVRLFRMVCEGVHSAHTSLVIHRDLKPSNILVTPAGVPKLLDFGIAKVLSPTRDPLHVNHTAEADRRLTPEYASPEQVSGAPMTTASDVYALGVILYELLTGVRPYSFSMRSTDEVRRVVCGQLPRPPSEAVPTRAAALRTAAQRTPALVDSATLPTAPPPSAVDHPRTRGVSATRLRGQLRGDLDNIVLMALRKEPPRRYASAEQFSADLGRFLSGLPVQARRDTWLYRSRKFVRRNAPAVMAGSAAVLLLAAGLIVRTQQKAQIERQRDELALTSARLAESRAFLVSVIGDAQAGGKGPAATLGEVLRDAEQTLALSPPSDPATRAGVQEAIGSALMTLGLTDRARPLLEAAQSVLQSEPPTSSVRLDIDTEMAQLLYYEGKAADAEAPLRELLAREERVNNAAPTARRGDLLNALGAVLRVTKRPDEALTVQSEALAVRRSVHGDSSLPVAESLNNIATIHMNMGRYDDAANAYQQTLDIRAARLRPGHPLRLATAMNLGLAHVRSGRVEPALPLLKEAAEGWSDGFGPDHPGRAASLTAYAQGLMKAGRATEAAEPLREALRWQTAHPATPDAAKLATRAQLAIALGQTAPCDDAMREFRSVRADASFGVLSAGLRKQFLIAMVSACERCGQPDERSRAAQDLKDLEATAKPDAPR